MHEVRPPRSLPAATTLALVSVLTVSLLAASGQPARADTLGSREHQRGAITRLEKGVMQMGIENTMLLSVQNEAGASASRMSWLGTLAVRRFVRDNIGVSLRGSMVYRKLGDVRDLGFLGTVWGNFYVRLGEGMFLSPGVGLGFLRTQRDIPMGTTVARTDITGGAAAAELMLSVFLGPRFSLTAGPEILLTAGGSAPENGESMGFSAVDSSLKVGAAYAF